MDKAVYEPNHRSTFIYLYRDNSWYIRDIEDTTSMLVECNDYNFEESLEEGCITIPLILIGEDFVWDG